MDTFMDNCIKKIVQKHILSLVSIYFDRRRKFDFFSQDFYTLCLTIPDMLEGVPLPILEEYEFKRMLFEKEMIEKESFMLQSNKIPRHTYSDWYFQFNETWKTEISQLSACKSIFEFYEKKFRKSFSLEKRSSVNLTLRNRIKAPP